MKDKDMKAICGVFVCQVINHQPEFLFKVALCVFAFLVKIESHTWHAIYTVDT